MFAKGQAVLALTFLVMVATLSLELQAQVVKTIPGKAVTYPVEVGRVTFVAAGDVIPHQAVKQAAEAQAKLQSEAAPMAQAAAASGGSQAATTASTQTPPATQTNGLTQVPAPQTVSGNEASGWQALLASVSDVFKRADFGFVNLETPVAPEHSRGSQPFLFDAPIALLQGLKASGVSIVSFANNHAMDQGWAGFAETLKHIRENGLVPAGAGDTADGAWKPAIVEKNGIKVGWLGMTRWLNGNRNPQDPAQPHVAFLPYASESGGAPGMDEAGLLAAIKAARAECDFLVVSIHWGVEYAPAPRQEDVDIAHKMVEAGAGLVLGHHPHVLQPIETYQAQDQHNAIIVYSMGNFLSNQSRTYVNGLAPDKTGDPRDSIMVRFAVVKRNYGPAGVRVELSDFGMLPVWGENNRLVVQSGRARIPMIRPVLIDRELPKVQARFDELAKPDAQLTDDQKKELVQVTQQLQTLTHRRELLLNRTGDDYVVPPPNQQ